MSVVLQDLDTDRFKRILIRQGKRDGVHIKMIQEIIQKKIKKTSKASKWKKAHIHAKWIGKENKESNKGRTIQTKKESQINKQATT